MGGTTFPPATGHRRQRRRRRFLASQQRIGSAYVAGVTLGSVTSYISAIVGTEQRFRPQQGIGGSVGGDAILCKQSVPRAERPSYARLPVAFPSVATAHRQRIRGWCHAGKRDLLRWRYCRGGTACPPATGHMKHWRASSSGEREIRVFFYDSCSEEEFRRGCRGLRWR